MSATSEPAGTLDVAMAHAAQFELGLSHQAPDEIAGKVTSDALLGAIFAGFPYRKIEPRPEGAGPSSKPVSELLPEAQADGSRHGGCNVGALNPTDRRIALRPAIKLRALVERVVHEQLK